MSRGHIAYYTQQLSFIIAVAMTICIGAICLGLDKTQMIQPVLRYVGFFYPYIELLSWVSDPDLTKSFCYFVLSFSLPVNKTKQSITTLA